MTAALSAEKSVSRERIEVKKMSRSKYPIDVRLTSTRGYFSQMPVCRQLVQQDDQLRMIIDFSPHVASAQRFSVMDSVSGQP